MIMLDKLTILRELKRLLQEHFHDDIKDVILFGSQAAGTAHEDSDYDVLIVLNRAYDWKFRDKVSEVIYDLELKYDILFDTHLISIDELENSLRGAQPIFRNALKRGVYA